uniref:Photosystem II extrinsic protein V n=1 Tax=Caloglossa monosticha TaxID=76906 RepID=A0A1Z1M583_9FLOR|nr:photosystem II cytochrome c550 [Caloglossa monosticha]ARW60955.1 photosystem II cytochrome c550 [Caloglossa monosticha]
MFKKNILLLFVNLLLCIYLFVLPVFAVELSEPNNVIQLNESGETTSVKSETLKRGKILFNAKCAQCHNGGITKNNPNIGLDSEALRLATPSRDNLINLVDYIKNPKSYDGVNSISETHPSVNNADIFIKMKNLTDNDLEAIAGYILVQATGLDNKWGAGKIYY